MDVQQNRAKKRGPVPVLAEIRFAAKCRETGGECIEWTGSVTNTGYGTFYAAPGRYVMAHRWAYEYDVGPIADGLHLDHLCRNRACVNPRHLEPVTARENLLRGETITAKNASKTHCPRGHEYSEENTYTPASTNNRQCRSCISERDRSRSTKNRKV